MVIFAFVPGVDPNDLDLQITEGCYRFLANAGRCASQMRALAPCMPTSVFPDASSVL